MKIAIVCGHFFPEMGYLEVHLANAFYQINHEVEVFTTRIVPSYVKNVAQVSNSTPYRINRLNTNFSLGQMVKSKGLASAVESFEPQLVICIGVGKLFPKPIYKMKNRKFTLITLFGDNEETYTSKGNIKKLKDITVQKFFKKKVYLLAIKKSDFLLPYTPSTNDVILKFLGKKYSEILTSKSRTISLGFDQNQFYFDELERKQQRMQLGVSSDSTLLITVTRVVPEKKLEAIVDFVDKLNKNGIALNYLIVGFQNDEYSRQLQDYIAQKEFKNNLYCKPFSNVSQIRKYYNAADTAIFTRAAISIFEALATGLYLVLPKHKNIGHILNEENGSYFSELNESVVLEAMNYKREERTNRVHLAKKFSYDNLVTQIAALVEV